MIQTYKILHDIDIIDKDKLFTTAQYQATRGQPYKLFKRRSRLNLRVNTFSKHFINNWNNLPAYVVNAPSVNAFKNRLNKHWHGYPSKFEATYYQTGQPTRGNRYQQASLQKGKQKSPGRATSRSRSQPPTPGGREKMTQINVCIANNQMHDKHKDRLPLPQARWSKC